VYVDPSGLGDARGIGRFTRGLLAALAEEVELRYGLPSSYAPAEAGALGHGAPGRVRALFKTALRHLDMRSAMRQADVALFPSIHWAPRRLPRPSVVVVHDVIPLLFPEKFDPGPWRGRLRAIAHRADAVAAVSEPAADDIARELGLPREKIAVIGQGVEVLPEHPSYPVPRRPYAVTIGYADPHKNTETLLLAFRRLRREGADIRLFVVGRDDLRPRAETLRLEDSVVFLGRMGDEALGSLLRHADLFLWPSLYEGFGLPPLEAIALGTPVIASYRPAMTTLLRGKAVFVEPLDSAAWAEAIREALADRTRLIRLTEKARAEVLEMTWAKVVEALLRLFERLVG